MNLFSKCIILFFLAGNFLNAQIDYELTGYITELPIYQQNNKQLSQLFNMEKNNFVNIGRIRIRPQIYLGSSSRINVEYEIASLYINSFSRFNLLSTGRTNRQLIDLTWNAVSDNKFSLNHFIDRLYFRYGFTNGNLIIGRQRISWGTGRIWNPTDLFNPINPANFSKIEKDGADAVSLKLIFGSFTDLHIVYNPLEKINDSNFGARFRTNFNEYDISFMGGRFDNIYVAGFDFAGNLFDAGIRGEGIYTFEDENYFKYILGCDYQFTPELYALIEYHFNGAGKSKKSEYQLLKLIRGDILNLNRNYLSASVSYLLTPLFNLSVSNTLNLKDKSGYLVLLGNYSLNENFDITAGLQMTYGDDFTEYWYYPASAYIKCDFYF